MSIQLLNDYYTHGTAEDLNPVERSLLAVILFRASNDGLCTLAPCELYRQVHILPNHGARYLCSLKDKGYIRRNGNAIEVLRPTPEEAPTKVVDEPTKMVDGPTRVVAKTTKVVAPIYIDIDKKDSRQTDVHAPVSSAVSYSGQQSPARNCVSRATRSPEAETFLKAYGKQPRDWEAFTAAFPSALEECQSLEVLCECAQRAYQKLVEVDETRFWPRPEKWLTNCEYRAYLRLSQQNHRVVVATSDPFAHQTERFRNLGWSDEDIAWVFDRARVYYQRCGNDEESLTRAFADLRKR